MKEFSRFVKRLEALGATEPGSHEVTRALDGHAYAELRSSIDITSRRASGAFFTGPFIAKRIPNLDSSPNIVLDPACGAGNLLLEQATRLQTMNSLLETIDYWGDRLWGFDIHQEFIDAAKLRLALLAKNKGGFHDKIPDISALFPNIVVGLSDR